MAFSTLLSSHKYPTELMQGGWRQTPSFYVVNGTLGWDLRNPLSYPCHLVRKPPEDLNDWEINIFLPEITEWWCFNTSIETLTKTMGNIPHPLFILKNICFFFICVCVCLHSQRSWVEAKRVHCIPRVVDIGNYELECELGFRRRPARGHGAIWLVPSFTFSNREHNLG